MSNFTSYINGKGCGSATYYIKEENDMRIDIKVKIPTGLNSKYINEVKINGKDYSKRISNIKIEHGAGRIPMVALTVIPDELNIITENIVPEFNLDSYTTTQLKQELSKRRKHDK